jgi:hypothetical protein
MSETVERYTTAPVDYDYGYVNVIEQYVGTTDNGKVIRRVEIPVERLEYQEGRYWSGMHRPWSPKEFAEMIDYGLVEIRR